jgi:hypothetical protein
LKRKKRVREVVAEIPETCMIIDLAFERYGFWEFTVGIAVIYQR